MLSVSSRSLYAERMLKDIRQAIGQTVKPKVGLLCFSILLLAVLVLSSNQCWSQVRLLDSSLLAWGQDTLKWKSFEGKLTDTNTIYGAECVTFIKQRFFVRNDSVFCRVQTFFNKSKSWRKHNLLNDYDLNHEVTHFDITELFARKSRKEMLEKEADEAQTQDILLKKAIECKEYHQRYDRESDHSRNRSYQTKWSSEIKSLLLELHKYRDIDIYISRPMLKTYWKERKSEHQQ